MSSRSSSRSSRPGSERSWPSSSPPTPLAVERPPSGRPRPPAGGGRMDTSPGVSAASAGSSVDALPPPPSLAFHKGASSRRSRSSLKLKPVRAIQDRDDFHVLLVASGLLCVNAGFVNLITLSSALALSTAHVTGLVAKTSTAVADEDWRFLYLPASAYLAFLCGSILGGYLISYEVFYLGRSYGKCLLLIAAIQAVAIVINQCSGNSTKEHEFLYACAVASGLQNSLTSKYSGNTVRTTHLTGATTDLGIALGHLLKGRWSDLWKVKLHSVAVAGFLLGGVAGRFAYKAWGGLALLVNVTLLAAMGVAHIVYLAWRERLPVLQVAKSTRDIKIHHHHHQQPQRSSSSVSFTSLPTWSCLRSGSGAVGAAAVTTSGSGLFAPRRANVELATQRAAGDGPSRTSATRASAHSTSLGPTSELADAEAKAPHPSSGDATPASAEKEAEPRPSSSSSPSGSFRSWARLVGLSASSIQMLRDAVTRRFGEDDAAYRQRTEEAETERQALRWRRLREQRRLERQVTRGPDAEEKGAGGDEDDEDDELSDSEVEFRAAETGEEGDFDAYEDDDVAGQTEDEEEQEQEQDDGEGRVLDTARLHSQERGEEAV